MMELLKRLFGRDNKENLDNLKKEIEILKDKLIKNRAEVVELQKELDFSLMRINERMIENYFGGDIKELREENRCISLDVSLLEDVVEDLIRDMDNNKAK